MSVNSSEKTAIPEFFTNITSEKGLIKTHIVPLIKEFLQNKCMIWKFSLVEEGKKREDISQYFAQKWCSILRKNDVQFWTTTENHFLLFYHKKKGQQINFKSSLLNLAKFSLKVGNSGSSAISTFLSSMQKVFTRIEEKYKEEEYFWILRPSPLESPSFLKIFNAFIKYSKANKMKVICYVQTTEEINTLKKYTFAQFAQVSFLNSEKVQNEENLPNYDEANPQLKVWIMETLLDYEPFPSSGLNLSIKERFQIVKNYEKQKKKDEEASKTEDSTFQQKEEGNQPESVGHRVVLPTPKKDIRESDYGTLPVSDLQNSQSLLQIADFNSVDVFDPDSNTILRDENYSQIQFSSHLNNPDRNDENYTAIPDSIQKEDQK